MRLANVLAVIALAATTGVQPASAKTCKEPLTATSRSTIQGGEQARTKRATDNAEKKWSKDAKAKYGLTYQLWFRADSKQVDCHQTPKSTVCKVTATPCRVI